MGCDIHENVEYIRGGKWVRASDKMGPACYFCQGTKVYHDKTCYFCKGSGTKWYINRNYMLFGVLAGVRWYDADHIEPRGLPEDITAASKKKFYEGNDHSASYFTLKELLEIKEKTQVITGYVDIKNYLEYKEIGFPSYWSNYIHKDSIISNEEMERRIKLKPFWDGDYFWTEIIWEMKNSQVKGKFWTEFVPAMAKLHKDPEKVRFVLWFDN